MEIKKRNQLILISFIIGFVLYSDAIFNHLLNVDTLHVVKGFGWTLSSGRWGLAILEVIVGKLFAYYSVNSFNMILSIVVLAITGYLFVETYEIKNRFLQYAMVLLTIIFPAIASIFLYPFTVLPYSLAILCIAISLIFISKQSKYQWITVWLVAFAVGVYQAYIALFIALLWLLMIKDLVVKNQCYRKVFFAGLKYIGLTLGALVVYFIVLHLTLIVTKTTLSNYVGISEMSNVKFSDIPFLLKDTYKQFFLYLFNKENIFYANTSLKMLTFTFFIALLILVYKHLAHPKVHRFSKLLFIVCILLLPLAINSIRLIYGRSTVHYHVNSMRTFYSFIVVWFLVMIVFDTFTFSNKIKNNIIAIFFGVLMLNYGFINHYAFYLLKLDNQRTMLLMNDIAQDILKMNRNVDNYQIALIGKVQVNENEHRSKLPKLDGVSYLINGYSREDYFKNILGYQWYPLDESKIKAIKTTKKFQQLNVYPSEGSILIEDGIIIVKLSK